MIKDSFELLVNKRDWSADFSWLAELVKVVRKKYIIRKAVSIALVSAVEMKNLNRVYRHKDRVTDVLSFTFDSADILGEIIICLPQASMQARQKKHSLRKELQVLTVHGLLHLLGYDHELGAKEELRQQQAEQEILKKI